MFYFQFRSNFFFIALVNLWYCKRLIYFKYVLHLALVLLTVILQLLRQQQSHQLQYISIASENCPLFTKFLHRRKSQPYNIGTFSLWHKCQYDLTSPWIIATLRSCPFTHQNCALHMAFTWAADDWQRANCLRYSFKLHSLVRPLSRRYQICLFITIVE